MTFNPYLTVRLCSNVPFSNDYKHTVKFENSNDQYTYFNSKVSHSFDHYSYQRMDNSIKVGANIDSLYNCNYVMYRNENFNKWIYCFIVEKRYINPNTTELILETDVFQTWQFEINWNPSYIGREHTKRWNEDGTPVVNTLDEGLDYGSEYDIVKVERFHPQSDIYFLVIGCKKSLHIKDSGGDYIINPNVNGIVQPLSFYIHPFRLDGTSPSVVIGGTTVALDRLQVVLQEIYKNDDAINNVVSLCVTENIGVETSYGVDGLVHFDQANFMFANIGESTIKTIGSMGLSGYQDIKKTFTNKYSGYANVSESKLLMYPYTTLTLTDYKGNQNTLKSEYINSKDITVVCKGSIGTNNKVSYHVENYNMSEQPYDEVSSLENAIICDNPNDVPIITDMLAAYLQGNRNTLAIQKSQINYNQNMNLITGSVGTIQSAVTGAGMGAIAGPAGMVAGGLSGAFTGIGSTMQSYVNSEYQIAGMNAKQKDIANTPPSMTKMGGNTYYDYGNNLTGVYLVKKQIKAEYRAKLEQYFKMYGYKVNQLKVPNLKTRAHFNYIQTVGANIYGDIPHEHINRLKGIFDSGITLWHGDWVGDYSRTNGDL